MKKLRIIIVSVALMAGILAPVAAQPAAALDIYGACNTGVASNVCAGKNERVQPFIQRLVNTLLYIAGALAVIMLIIGGIRYSASAGNSSQTTAAKNTILYSIVGLVVAVFAYAIVNFVLFNLNIK